jgi:hypothetical protein
MKGIKIENEENPIGNWFFFKDCVNNTEKRKKP